MADEFQFVPGQRFEAPQADIASPVQDGIKTGMQLALLKENVDAKRNEIEMKRQELKDKAITSGFDFLAKAAKIKGPAQKVMFQYARERLSMAGHNISEDVLSFLKSNYQPLLAAIQKVQNGGGRFSSAEGLGAIVQALEEGADITELQKIMDDVMAFERAEVAAATQAKVATINTAPRDVGNQIEDKIQKLKEIDNDPDLSPEQKKEYKDRIMAVGGASGRNSQNSLDQRTHNQIVNRIKSDTNLKNMFTQMSNLDNAFRLITEAKNITPQQVEEFQQAVRSNLGIKGTGGVTERQKTFIRTLGMNVDSLIQFITGKPADIAKDNMVIQHFKELVAIEQKSIQANYKRRLSGLAAGADSMYARRADLKGDLEKLVGAFTAGTAGSAGEVDINLERTRAQNAIRQRPDMEQKIRAKFKSKTGQDL